MIIILFLSADFISSLLLNAWPMKISFRFAWTKSGSCWFLIHCRYESIFWPRFQFFFVMLGLLASLISERDDWIIFKQYLNKEQSKVYFWKVIEKGWQVNEMGTRWCFVFKHSKEREGSPFFYYFVSSFFSLAWPSVMFVLLIKLEEYSWDKQYCPATWASATLNI